MIIRYNIMIFRECQSGRRHSGPLSIHSSAFPLSIPQPVLPPFLCPFLRHSSSLSFACFSGQFSACFSLLLMSFFCRFLLFFFLRFHAALSACRAQRSCREPLIRRIRKLIVQDRLWRSCRAALGDRRSPSAERGCASSRARCARNAVRARTAGDFISAVLSCVAPCRLLQSEESSGCNVQLPCLPVKTIDRVSQDLFRRYLVCIDLTDHLQKLVRIDPL